jgi:hypothetical protein
MSKTKYQLEEEIFQLKNQIAGLGHKPVDVTMHVETSEATQIISDLEKRVAQVEKANTAVQRERDRAEEGLRQEKHDFLVVEAESDLWRRKYEEALKIGGGLIGRYKAISDILADLLADKKELPHHYGCEVARVIEIALAKDKPAEETQSG